MVYLYYIIGALLESIKSPCVSRTFSLKDLLLTGFRGVFRRLLGYQSLRRILSLPLLDRQSRSFRGLSELDQWDQLLLGPGRVVRGCQHWRLNDS